MQDGLGALCASYAAGRLEKGEIGGITHRNIRSRLGSLVAAVGDVPIDQLDRQAIGRWQRTIGHHSPATRRAYLSTVKLFCSWLVDEGYLGVDPAARAGRVREPRRVPRALPTTAVAELILSADRRGAAILWLMVGLGLRCCEVANLEVGHWDPLAATLMIRGKAGHERLLPVPVEVAEALAAYLDTVGRSAGPMIRDSGRAVTANWLSKRVAGWMSSAGVKRTARDGISAHALRHTAASDIFERCHDIRTVQEILGHASIATTQVYLRRADLGRMREAMAGRNYRSAA